MHAVSRLAPAALLAILAWPSVFAAAAPAEGRVHVAQRILGGTGAPQAVHCSAVGGANSTVEGPGGSVGMCTLPSGDTCQAMQFFRDGSCVDAEGENVIDPEDMIDYGTNDGSDTSDGESGGDADASE